MLTFSRYLALIFALALGIGEAVMNWGHWQYAPLWVVDYVIVGWLLWGFFETRRGRKIHLLFGGWAFSAGVFYMALFLSLDPELAPHIKADTTLLFLIGLLLALSLLGGLGALIARNAQQKEPSDARNSGAPR